MPVCPTCGKKIALSWQMEKHQKSSRCKLYLKTKEFDRVSGELQVMCRNVEKLQAALLALEQEKQIYIPDPESRKHMDQIMNKLQQIWDFIQQEHNSPEPHPANTSSSSSICSTENSPVVSETQTIIPSSPENGNTNNLSVSASEHVISMHNELKEYLKHARPSVIKLAESHQVPHLIDLFSKLAADEPENEVRHIRNSPPPIAEQKIPIPEIIQKRENVDKIINTLQQISTGSDAEVIIQKDKPANPNKSIIYQEISRYGSPNEEIVGKDAETQINISDLQKLEPFDSDVGKRSICKINIEDNNLTSNSINLSSALQNEKVSIPNNEIGHGMQARTRSDAYISCDIGTQTVINRSRKPHSAKALGK